MAINSAEGVSPIILNVPLASLCSNLTFSDPSSERSAASDALSAVVLSLKAILVSYTRKEPVG